MTNNTIDEDYEVDDKGNIYQPEDSTSPYATKVEMKERDPLVDKGNNSFLYSTETIGDEELKFGKRSNKKRDMKKSPITDDERREYKQKYLNQFSDGNAKKIAEDEYAAKKPKDIDKEIEDNSNRMINDTDKAKFENDILQHIDQIQEKGNGNPINIDTYISALRNQAKDNKDSQAYLYGVSSQLVQKMRDKAKKYNDSVKQLGDSRSYDKLAETNQNVKDTAKATQAKVDITSKATQDTVKSESANIQKKIDDTYQDALKESSKLDDLYKKIPELQVYNKDEALVEARSNTTKAYEQLDKARDDKEDNPEAYRQQLQQYYDTVSVENAEASRVSTSDKYLQGAKEGLKATQQFTEEAKKDTSWLPKGIIQSYLNGDFGKKAYVQQKDDNGNPMFDENGKPIYKMHQVKKLDANGHQIYTEKPVLNNKGEQAIGFDGKPETQKIYQYEDKPVEKYPSQAKHALGYYLMDTIGNMLTNASGYMPGRNAQPTTSAWKKMQEEKAASYQNAINASRNTGVTKNADAVASFGQHNVDLMNKLDDMGIDTQKLRNSKQIESDQTYELEALVNAGTYMNKLDDTTKNALFDAMIMTSDNIDQATAAILKRSYEAGPLKEFINSVISTGGTMLESLTGLINKLNGYLDKADRIDISKAGKGAAAKEVVKEATGWNKNNIEQLRGNINYSGGNSIRTTLASIKKEKAGKNRANKIAGYEKDLQRYKNTFLKNVKDYQKAYKDYYGKEADISEWNDIMEAFK